MKAEEKAKEQAALKPCPFCGGDAVIKQTGRLKITIRCQKCLMGLTQKVFRYSLEWLEDKVIEAWNTRVKQ